MKNFNIPIVAIFLYSFSPFTIAAPSSTPRGLAHLFKREVQINNCNPDETKAIQAALTDLNGLTAHAIETIGKDGWDSNKGFGYSLHASSRS
jgi:hypothetical protein